MGLAQTQRVLARLYTDSDFRERFIAQPAGVGAAFGLLREETARLARLSISDLDYFATSLKRKRLHEARALLPLTYGVLAERFTALFLRYADTHLPRGIRKHQEDAAAFVAFLERVDRSQGIAPPWAVDLARLEAARLIAADPARRWTACRLRHNPDRLTRSAIQPEETSPPPGRPTIIIWFRLSRRHRLRRVVLSIGRVDNQPGD
jgi:hypothetical protein